MYPGQQQPRTERQPQTVMMASNITSNPYTRPVIVRYAYKIAEPPRDEVQGGRYKIPHGTVQLSNPPWDTCPLSMNLYETYDERVYRGIRDPGTHAHACQYGRFIPPKYEPPPPKRRPPTKIDINQRKSGKSLSHWGYTRTKRGGYFTS